MLNSQAFYLEVHHHNPEYLLEVSASGKTFLLGCQGTESPEYFKLYQEEVNSFGLIQKFSLLDVPESFKKAMQINKSQEIKQKQIEANQLMKKVEYWQYEEFDVIVQAAQSYTERIDRALADIICDSNPFWFIKNLAYSAYWDSPKLKQNNVRLLFYESRK